MKNIILLIIGTMCCAWASVTDVLKPSSKDMHAKTDAWTGFWNLEERNHTLDRILMAYGEPEMVGKTALRDFVTKEGDTITELYELVFRDMPHVYNALRYEWQHDDERTLVLFFASDAPQGKPLGGYLYKPELFQISDAYYTRPKYYYSPRNWDHEDDTVHWDTITKSTDWISFRYLDERKLSPHDISEMYGEPIRIETGKCGRYSLGYSTYVLKGIYSQSFAKYHKDSITEYVWEIADHYFLDMFYVKTENGDSAIAGYYNECEVLPE